MKTLKISDTLHKKLKVYAAKESINITNFVEYAISKEMGLVKSPAKLSKAKSQ